MNNFAGQLWLGNLHCAKFIAKMLALNKKRNYKDKEKISEMLYLLTGEIELPPYYYNIHKVCKLHGLKAMPRTDLVLQTLNDHGYKAVKTHFSKIAIKSDAPYKTILEGMRTCSKD